MLGRLLPLLTTCALGCAVGKLEVRGAPPRAYDAVIVPGCPSQADGSLSRCQISRAAWAALLWERGWAQHFITSGAAVHSPHVEAEALAAAMTALGVPPDRIYLEPNALHTDENMYFSLQIARALGFRTLAVASQRGHAAWGCRMLVDWGQPCGAISVDLPAAKERHRAAEPALAQVRTPPVDRWLALDERERQIAVASGRPRRPPSFLLYPWLGWLRLSGEVWTPHAPNQPPLLTWASRTADWNTFH
jgi:hypothetical protein